jgi:streptogramin lyase/mono/diheme cytochrome c family protein
MHYRLAVLMCALLACPLAVGEPGPTITRRDYDMSKLVAASVLPPAEQAGRRLYTPRCANCHEALSTAVVQLYGPDVSRETVQKLGDAGMRVVIGNGSERMPGFRYALDDEQVGQIIAYLRTRAPAPPPAAAAETGTPALPPNPDSSGPGSITDANTASPSQRQGSSGTKLIADARPNLWGNVRSAEGRPLAGASVSARAVGTTITTSVYTDESGHYVFPGLAPGTYLVWAQAVGYSTGRGEYRVDRGASQSFRLSRLADYSEQLRGSDWLAWLPEGSAKERQMKELVRDNCMECHSLSVALHQRFDEAGWLAILNLMERSTYDGWLGPPKPARSHSDVGNETGGASELIIHRHKAELAKYLAAVRGPSFSAATLRAPPAPSGDAARVVVTEYDVPSDVTGELNSVTGADRSQGPASANHAAGGDVHDVMVDDAGAAWVTSVVYVVTRTIARVDTTTGQVTDFRIANETGDAEWSHGIARDAKGHLWADGDGILMPIDPVTSTIRVIRPPDGLGTGPRITTDVDNQGFIWSATRYGGVRYDPVRNRWRLFGNVTLGDGFSYGMVADGQGRGWWTQFCADRVEMGDPATGRTTEFRMALDEQRASVASADDKDFYASIGALEWGGINTVPGSQAPRRLGADKAAGIVWVPNYLGLNLARIDVATGAVSYVPMPIPATPYFVSVDKQHNVWMNTLSDDALFRFNPSTKEWTIFSLPSLGCESRHMSLDEKRGEAWIGCSRSSRIGRFQFRSAEQLAAAKAAER